MPPPTKLTHLQYTHQPNSPTFSKTQSTPTSQTHLSSVKLGTPTSHTHPSSVKFRVQDWPSGSIWCQWRWQAQKRQWSEPVMFASGTLQSPAVQSSHSQMTTPLPVNTQTQQNDHISPCQHMVINIGPCAVYKGIFWSKSNDPQFV